MIYGMSNRHSLDNPCNSNLLLRTSSNCQHILSPTIPHSGLTTQTEEEEEEEEPSDGVEDLVMNATSERKLLLHYTSNNVDTASSSPFNNLACPSDSNKGEEGLQEGYFEKSQQDHAENRKNYPPSPVSQVPIYSPMPVSSLNYSSAQQTFYHPHTQTQGCYSLASSPQPSFGLYFSGVQPTRPFMNKVNGYASSYMHAPPSAAATLCSPPTTPLPLPNPSQIQHAPVPGYQSSFDRLSQHPHPNMFPGIRLQDLECFRTLGTGTFGRVYLSRLRSNPNVYFALKMMQKSEILRLKQLDHVYNEKMILASLQCPFVVQLYCTFRNSRNVYMLLEYACGGELFSYLRKFSRFPLEMARFYASEILLAIEYLHDRNIVYRDLKPENILLDQKGHVKLTDFGFAKIVSDRTWTLCGTPEYLAPEIIQGRGHGKEVDWWALGVLIYEMLVGCPPFYDHTPFGMYEKILSGVLVFPDWMDPVSKDLIARLLRLDKAQRLGNLKNGAKDIKAHPWFRNVNWNGLMAKTIIAPLIPKYSFPGDSSNFEIYPELKDEPNPEWEADPFQHLFTTF